MRAHDAARDAEGAVRIFLDSREAPAATVETRRRALAALAAGRALRRGLAGIAVQNRTGGGVNFLRGKLSVDGFWDYFFVAFGVKSRARVPPRASSRRPSVLAGGKRVSTSRSSRRSSFPRSTSSCPGWRPPTTSGSATCSRRIRSSRPRRSSSSFRALPPRAAAAVLAARCRVSRPAETLAVHPHELSFFNAARAARRHGAAWLNDSNLDWGQDLGRLAARLQGRGEEAGLTVAYFGGDDPAYSAAPGRRLRAGAAGRLARASTPSRRSSSAAARRRWSSTATARAPAASSASAARCGSAGRVAPDAWDTRSILFGVSGARRARDEAVDRHARLQRARDDPRDRGAASSPSTSGGLERETRHRRRRLDGRHARHPPRDGRHGRRPRLLPAAQHGQGRGRLDGDAGLDGRHRR